MASPTRWTWVWVNSGSWWWTGRPDVLQFMSSQRIRHDWATELNWKWTETWFNLCPGIAIHLPRCRYGEEVGGPKCWTWVCSHFKSRSFQETKFQLVRISRYTSRLVPFVLESAWRIWRMGLFFPYSLSFEAVQRAHHYFQSHLRGSNLVPKPLLWTASLHLLQLLLSQAVSFVVSLLSANAPLLLDAVL